MEQNKYVLKKNGSAFDLWVEGEDKRRAILLGMTYLEDGEHRALCERVVATLNFCADVPLQDLLGGEDAAKS